MRTGLQAPGLKPETKICGCENAALEEKKTWHLETLAAW